MRTILACLFAGVLLLTGCTGPHYREYFLYRDDGTIKPRVVFLPAKAEASDEERAAGYFDESLRWIAMDRGELFLYSKEQVDAQCRSIKQDDPIKCPQAFNPADFIVQVEVIEDAILPVDQAGCATFVPLLGMKNRSVLRVKLRLELIDIRDGQQKVALYEIIEKSQLLPNRPAPQCGPVTLYEELAYQAMDRIEDAIRCAR